MVGLVLSMVAILAVVYGFNVVSQRNPATVSPTNPLRDIYGWTYWEVWAWIGAGAILLLVYIFYELRIKDPVVDLRLFKERDFFTSSIMTWALRGFLFGSFFLIPVFLENIRDPKLSATSAGMATMPMGLASAVAVVLTGRKLYAAMGPRYLVLTGMLLLAASNVLLLGINNETDGWSLIPAMVLRGLGFGMTGIPLQTLALEKLKGMALPKASSLYNASAQIFSSIGVAVLTTIFVQQTTAHRPSDVQIAQISNQVQQQLVPQFLAQHPGLTPATLQTSPDFLVLSQQIKSEVTARVTVEAGVPALTDVFTIVTIALVALVLLALILPGKGSARPAEEGAGSEQRGAAIGVE
jgi:DHA2 family multidrug resistance protein